MPKTTVISEKQAEKVIEFVKYGGFDLKVINAKHDLVPKSAYSVILEEDQKKTLAMAISNNMPALLIGETGTGKTSVVRELAHLLKQPYVRVNMTGFTTPDELIGSKSVKDGATYYEMGVITNAMKIGAILVLDEINATTPDCMFIIHGLLDEDKQITLPNGEVIVPHEDFRVFATCNPDYEGTRAMNKAFLDRFPIIMMIDTLAPDKEQELIMNKTGIDADLANKLVTVATLARHDYKEQKLSIYVSSRALLNVAKLIQSGLDVKQAYNTSIVQKTSAKDEQGLMMDFFLSVFKKASGASADNFPVVTTQKVLNELKLIAEKGEAAIASVTAEKNVFMAQCNELATALSKAEQIIRTKDQSFRDLENRSIELEKKIQTLRGVEEIIKVANELNNENRGKLQ